MLCGYVILWLKELLFGDYELVKIGGFGVFCVWVIFDVGLLFQIEGVGDVVFEIEVFCVRVVFWSCGGKSVLFDFLFLQKVFFMVEFFGKLLFCLGVVGCDLVEFSSDCFVLQSQLYLIRVSVDHVEGFLQVDVVE